MPMWRPVLNGLVNASVKTQRGIEADAARPPGPTGIE
jgi:hypothetical protein